MQRWQQGCPSRLQLSAGIVAVPFFKGVFVFDNSPLYLFSLCSDTMCPPLDCPGPCAYVGLCIWWIWSCLLLNHLQRLEGVNSERTHHFQDPESGQKTSKFKLGHCLVATEHWQILLFVFLSHYLLFGGDNSAYCVGVESLK